MSRCSLFTAISAAFIVAVSARNDVGRAISTMDGRVYCPILLFGTQCPASSIFHYYECCGDFNNDCCFNLHVWVTIVLTLLAIFILSSFVLFLSRFFCFCL